MADASIDEIVAVIRAELSDFKKGMKEVEDSANKATEEVKNKFGALGKNLQDVGKKMSLYVTLPLTALGYKAVASFNQQEKAIVLLNSALKATGGTVGYTSDQLVKMSEDLQKVSTFADEDILQNVSLGLLKFRTITKDVFREAQQVILDYAAQTGNSLEGATQQIGRALEDPAVGLTLLKRAGVVFTDQQEKMIQKMERVGDTAGAQGIILKALEGKFHGAAKAMAESKPGSLAQAWNTVDDALEEVGKAMMDFIVPAAQVVKDLAISFQGLTPETKKFLVVLAGIAAVIGPVTKLVGMMISAWGAVSSAITFLTPAFTAVGTAIAGITAPIAVAIAALGLLVFGVVHYWDQIKALGRAAIRIFQPQIDAFNYLKNEALGFVSDIYNGLKDWATNKMQMVSNFIKEKIDSIVGFFTDMGARIKDGIDKMTPDIVKKGVKLFKDFMGPAVEYVKKGVGIVREELSKTGDAAQEMGPPIALAGKNLKDLGASAAVLKTISPQAQEVKDKLKELAFQTEIARGAFKGLEQGAPELLNQMGLLNDKNTQLSQSAYQLNAALGDLRRATEGKAVFEDTRTDAENYAIQLNKLNELYATGAINQETYARASDKLRQNFVQNSPVIGKIIGIMSDNFSKFATDVVLGTESIGKAFESMVKNIFEQIVAFLINALVQQFFGLLAGLLFGGPAGLGAAVLGGVTGAASGGATGSAHGNVFSGPVHPFAQGGLIRGPVAFPMNRGTGIAGEAGQEAIFPIVRTRSGDLGVRAEGGNGGGNQSTPTEEEYSTIHNHIYLNDKPFLEVVSQGSRDGRLTISKRSIREKQ